VAGSREDGIVYCSMSVGRLLASVGHQSVVNWKGCERKRQYPDLMFCSALDWEVERKDPEHFTSG